MALQFAATQRVGRPSQVPAAMAMAGGVGGGAGCVCEKKRGVRSPCAAAASCKRLRAPPLDGGATGAGGSDGGMHIPLEGATGAGVGGGGSLSRGAHPYGVQPEGNMLLDECGHAARSRGLGALRALDDDALLELLEWLPAADLARFTAASRAAYAFGHHDDLWRALALGGGGSADGIAFVGCWKTTVVGAELARRRRGGAAGPPPPAHVPLQVPGLYSDALFQRWFSFSFALRPDMLSRDNMERRAADGLSVAEFVAEYEAPGRPVLITGALAGWRALTAWRDTAALAELCGDALFVAGAATMTLPQYMVYAGAATDDNPLYLFDAKFAQKVPRLAEDYSVPPYFREDQFSLLGDARPDYRWLIIGPRSSGSSFHIDPNATNAWNAVVVGAKKWIMFPPGATPPGVLPSSDMSQVVSPVSLTEWFCAFYDEARTASPPPVECVCRAGELVFVPRGWWHMVVNVEDSIAVTQNYVSRRNLLPCLRFLGTKPDQVSGVSGGEEARRTLGARLEAAFEGAFPGELATLRRTAPLARSRGPRQGWAAATASASAGGTFSFGL